MVLLFIGIIVCFVLSITLTPLIIKLAPMIGAVDKPNNRKVHQKVMPRMGGLAIFISFLVGSLIVSPNDPFHLAIIIGAFIIIMIGMLDDIYELSAKWKVAGQLAAAMTVVIYGGLQIEFINLPFGGAIEFGFLSVPITIFWILAFTNAINLIDGLDGLAAGVSSIGLFTLAVVAFLMGNDYVLIISLMILASTLGFLVFNFHPAKIFMGDTGALFLGYIFGTLSVLGFKNVTIVSFIIPVLILGLPIFDTIFAMIRRKVNNVPLYLADKSHVHHCLLSFGFSHRQTVFVIYAISILLGSSAILFSMATIFWSIIIILTVLLAMEIMAESLGMVSEKYRPILNFLAFSLPRGGSKR